MIRFSNFSDLGPLAPSELWVYPRGSRLYDVAGTLLDPGRPAQRITDLKGWVLGPGDDEKKIDVDGSSQQFRKLKKQRALDLYFESLFDGADIDIEDDVELWFLLPAFADDKQRLGYRAQLQRAAEHVRPQANVRFLFESDMVLEYFRLVRGQLELQPAKNNFFLVIDCGAVTCNMTLVTSTRGRRVSDATAGRGGTLVARPGQSVLGAGRFVDEQLWRRTLGKGVAATTEFPQVARSSMELAKIRCATTGRSVFVTSPDTTTVEITADLLEEMATELWQNYAEQLKTLLRETYEHFSARGPYREQFEEEGINDPESLGAHLSGIVLAGGTSQLPGFEKELRRRLQLEDEIPTFRVGPEYPFVAGLGGMAYLLKRKHLETSATASSSGTAGSDFVASLQDDLYLADVDGKRLSKIVDRTGWPHDYLEGKEAHLPRRWGGKLIRAAIGIGSDPVGTDPRANLILGSFSTNQGYLVYKPHKRPDPIIVRANPSGTELTIEVLDKRQRTRKTFQFLVDDTAPITKPGQDGRPATENESSFAVIDFGMSKSVVGHCDGLPGSLPDHKTFEKSTRVPALALGWRVDAEPPPPPPSRPSERPGTTPSIPSPPPELPRPSPRPRPAVTTYRDVEELEFLGEACAAFDERGVSKRDFLGLHLVAKTMSPLTLLVGPPGSGKTSLVRSYAAALGYGQEDGGLIWVPVQAHWISDEGLAGVLADKWRALEDDPRALSFVLLDEFNLTRPEYYLATVLAQFDGGMKEDRRLRVPVDDDGGVRALLFGTLNVDETSRPPADKIADRAFLFELMESPPVETIEPFRLHHGEYRVSIASWRQWTRVPSSLEIPPEIRDLVGRLKEIERKVQRSAHEVLTPSRRGLRDVSYLLHEYERLGLESLDPGFSRDAALDLAVSGRLLPRLRGPSNVMADALKELQKFFTNSETRWHRCADRVSFMLRQISEGYVSFWG